MKKAGKRKEKRWKKDRKKDGKRGKKMKHNEKTESICGKQVFSIKNRIVGHTQRHARGKRDAGLFTIFFSHSTFVSTGGWFLDHRLPGVSGVRAR